MRASVLLTLASKECGTLNSADYVLFDEVRKNDLNNCRGAYRVPFQEIADRLRLPAGDLDKSSGVSRQEIVAGSDTSLFGTARSRLQILRCSFQARHWRGGPEPRRKGRNLCLTQGAKLYR
jgi:hypothetical protein